MSHLQYVRYCRNLGLSEDLYQGVPYPHPYLLIWLECRRQANPWSGIPALPDPSKGYLDQDAELTLACDLLDEMQTQREREKERRDQMLEQTRNYFGGGSDEDDEAQQGQTTQIKNREGRRVLPFPSRSPHS